MSVRRDPRHKTLHANAYAEDPTQSSLHTRPYTQHPTPNSQHTSHKPQQTTPCLGFAHTEVGLQQFASLMHSRIFIHSNTWIHTCINSRVQKSASTTAPCARHRRVRQHVQQCCNVRSHAHAKHTSWFACWQPHSYAVQQTLSKP